MPKIPVIPNKVLTVQEVSNYLRVHRSTIYRLLKQRRLPAFRVGSDWRFNIEAIDRWRSEMEASSLGAEFEPSGGTRRPASRQRGN
jgi:excisionase family DNA binding protein